MEDKEILESNNLIAEFMGDNFIIEDLKNRQMHCYGTKKLEYHSSWDWLMPVVEKISEFKYEDGDTAYPRTFGVIEDGKKMFRLNRHQLFRCDTLIEATWLSVVNFIRWHKWINEQKKQ